MLGPNGAGKSTHPRLLRRGHPPHLRAPCTCSATQLGRVELQALRRMIGHVNPRHPLRSPLTVRDIVLTGLTGTIEHDAALAADGRRRPRGPTTLIGSLGLGAQGRRRGGTCCPRASAAGCSSPGR